MRLPRGGFDAYSVAAGPYGYTDELNLVWSSSDDAIAHVEEDGTVRAISEGFCTITAALADNDTVSATCDVHVEPSEYGIHATSPSDSIAVGDTIQIAYRLVLPEEDSLATEFTSWNEDLATIDENGTVTALAPGSARFEIRHGDYVTTCGVNIIQPLKAISITGQAVIDVSAPAEFTASLEPANATVGRIVWSSANETVARVSQDGVVTGIRPGSTTIQAYCSGVVATFDVEVKANLTGIMLNTTTGTMRLDRTKQLEVLYKPTNTTDEKGVTWQSSQPAVASVSDDGKVTAHERGIAVITATSNTGNHKATYTVTVIGLRDPATGITVTNSDDTDTGENVVLSVTPLENGPSISEVESVRSSYDIHLEQMGTEAQPERMVDVEIPIPDGTNTNMLVVLRQEANGSLTDMEARLENGFMVFSTEHFSKYVLGIGHQWDQGYTIVNEATCSNEGIEAIRCLTCGATKDARAVPATGHSWSEPAIVFSDDGRSAVATWSCANDASHAVERTCEVTSRMATEPTLDDAGTTEYTASAAGDEALGLPSGTATTTRTDIPALGREYGPCVISFSDDGKEATGSWTCTADPSNVRTATCSVSSVVTRPSTCTEVGQTTYTATAAGDEALGLAPGELSTARDDVPALGHDFVGEDGGCARCDASVVISMISETGRYCVSYAPAATIGRGSALFHGEPMVWSDRFNAWVAVVDGPVDAKALSKAFGVDAGVERVSLPAFGSALYGDVNGNGATNIVDAQITYDMARGKYGAGSITPVSWLLADVNEDDCVDAVDAFAIQQAIHHGWPHS